MIEDFEDVLAIAVSVLAIGIFGVSLLAYRRRPTTRTLLLVVAFGVYVAKGVFLTLELFMDDQTEVWDYMAVLSDLVFLVLISLAFLKR